MTNHATATSFASPGDYDVSDYSEDTEAPSFHPAPVTTYKVTGDRAKLYSALAKAQAGFEPVKKTRTVTVKPNNSPPYTFDYAPLDEVLSCCVPSLNANGYALIQPLSREGTDGDWTLRTLLLHESGGSIEVEATIGAQENPQKLGSIVTYLRRYAATGLLGVVAEADDDANTAAGNEVQSQQQKQPQQARQAPAQKPQPRTQPKPPVVPARPASAPPGPGVRQASAPPPAAVRSPSAPPENDVVDGWIDPEPSVPNTLPLVKGTPLAQTLGDYMQARSFASKDEMVEFVRSVTGKAPNELSCGDARELIGKLFVHGVRVAA